LRLRELFGFKFARSAGPVLALSNAFAMLILAASDQPNATVALAVRTLGWMSWLVGASAGTSTAQNLAERDVIDGIDELVLQRGLERKALPAARFAAAAKRMAVLIGFPTLFLGLLCMALSTTWPLFLHRSLLCIQMLVYAITMATVFAAIARVASALLPAHGRLLFLAALLLPHLAHRLNSAVPSILDLFETASEQLLQRALRA
jgi:hypothetical protein